MNQYGYVPIENSHLLQQTYSVASPQTWTFSRNGIDYGGVEEVVFTADQKAEIVVLGGQYFENAAGFMAWLNG